MQRFEMQAKDSEGCSRHCNLQFVGFPEGAEGKAPELFLEQWLQRHRY